MKVNGGRNTLFWEDTWAADVPLRLKFHKVYIYCRFNNVLVKECWSAGEWRFDFCRTFGPAELREWDELLTLLHDCDLGDSPDKATWVLEKSGVFTTRSIYRHLSLRGVTNKRMQLVWGSKLPMKLKVFLWMGFQNRLPTGSALKRRKWKGDDKCVLCRVTETTEHILFRCCMAHFVPVCFKEALGWDRIPTGMNDFLENRILLGAPRYKFKLFLFCNSVLGALESSQHES